MKKTYLQFPSWKQKNHAAKITSRRTVQRFFDSVAYKSDAPDGDTTVKELTDETDPENKALPEDTDEVKALKKISRQVKQFNAILGTKAKAEDFTAVNTQLTELKGKIGEMEADKISEAIEKINESNEKIWKQIVELQEETAKGKEDGGSTAPKKGIQINRKDIEAFIKATFDESGKKTHNQASIVIKAPEIMGMATFFEGGADTVIDAFTGRVVDPVLYQRRRKPNLILDNFDIPQIAAPKLIFLVKVEEGNSSSISGDPGGAEWILSSEAKPRRSFRVTTGEAEAKKVAIFSTVEDKLLKDVTSLENWIREDMMQEIREKINDGLLNNDVAVDPKAPQGMKQEAIQFTATDGYDGTIDDPNYIDAIFAIAAMFADNFETLDKVFVNSDVYYLIRHLKDNEGRYQNNNLVYVDSLNRLFIGGVQVVMAIGDDIPSTHVLAVGMDMGFKMKAYGPLVFERGLNGEDFRYDRTSFRAYQEFLTYLPTHRENSVMYDTWENIFAAITAGSI